MSERERERELAARCSGNFKLLPDCPVRLGWTSELVDIQGESFGECVHWILALAIVFSKIYGAFHDAYASRTLDIEAAVIFYRTANALVRRAFYSKILRHFVKHVGK